MDDRTSTAATATPQLKSMMTPTLWLVVTSGIFLFLYSLYINQFSGSRVDDFAVVPFSGQPAFHQAQSLFAERNITHESTAIELNSDMMPAKFVVQVVTPARGQLDYQLSLLDEQGNEVWQESGQQYWDKSGSSDSAEKHRTLGLTPFSIEHSGRYTLLASLQGGYDHGITLRRNVAEASIVIYAIAGLALLSGILMLVRAGKNSPQDPA